MFKQNVTHDDAIKMVEIIGEALKWERHVDAMGISYYGKNENVVVRISDHSTHLETWVKYNTNETPNKYSIVIEVNPSKPITEINSNVPQFMVYEYKHKLNQIINDNNDVVINMGNAINGIMSGDFQFSNPYNVNRKILVSKYLDKENNKKIIKCNNMKTSKNVIRINESQLKQMISESVRNILKDDNYDNQWKSSFKTGNHGEVMETYNSLRKLKETIPLLYFTNRLNDNVAIKLKTAADILNKYLTDDIINSIVNFYRQYSMHADRKPQDLSVPFTNRYPKDFKEPEDWYERNEHGDFDNY